MKKNLLLIGAVLMTIQVSNAQIGSQDLAAKQDIEKELEKYSFTVQTGRIDEIIFNLKQNKRTNDRFNELSTKYNSIGGKSDYTLRQIKRVDDFYAKMNTERTPELEKKADKVFTNSLNTNYNGIELVLNGNKQEQWKVHPDYVTEDLNKLLIILNEEKTYLFKDNTKVDALINKCETEKQRLGTYIKSDYPAYKEAYHKEYLKTILLGQPGMNDPALSGFIKTTFDAKYGKVIKAVIVDKNWIVEKNGAGIPMRKFATFNASVKQADGACHKHWGKVSMQYEGGGKYGEKHLIYSNSEEMSCENANK